MLHKASRRWMKEVLTVRNVVGVLFLNGSAMWHDQVRLVGPFLAEVLWSKWIGTIEHPEWYTNVSRTPSASGMMRPGHLHTHTLIPNSSLE